MTTHDPLLVEYPIVFLSDVYPDGESVVVAEHPDLPGCAAYGKTNDEARAALANARVAYVKYRIAHGMTVRPPSGDEKMEWHSGPITGNAPPVPHSSQWTFSGQKTPPFSPAMAAR